MDSKTMKVLDVLHEANYELLLEVDRVCKKHGITYFLGDGTLLGATRSQDFIPWDDDSDLIMFRGEYEKFREAMKAEKREDIAFIDFRNYPEFYDFIPKLANMKVTYREIQYGGGDYYGGRYNHPTLDIFILDGAPRHFGFMSFRLKLIYAMAMGHRQTIHYDAHAGFMRIPLKILSALGRKIPMEKLWKWYEGTAQSVRKDTGKLFKSNDLMTPPYWGLIFEKEIFQPGREMQFHGHAFPVPGQTERFLEMTYGDYMTPVPESEQRPMHVVDLVDGPDTDVPE